MIRSKQLADIITLHNDTTYTNFYHPDPILKLLYLSSTPKIINI